MQFEISTDIKVEGKDLKKGKIFKFPFSYRGGLEADAGFLFQANDESIWMLIGKKTTIHFIGYEQAGTLAEDSQDDSDDGDFMDFGMI